MAEESIERKVLRASLRMMLESWINILIRDVSSYAAKVEKVPVSEVKKLLVELIATADPPAQDAPGK